MKSILIPVIVLFFLPFAGYSQKHKIQEDALKLLAHETLSAADDSSKLKSNKLFEEKLLDVLTIPASFDYPFDSLKTVGKVTSPDKKFRIYNWNVLLSDGTSRYFAVIQVRKGKKDINIYELKEPQTPIADPETKILNADNWFGALYYKVIAEKYGSRDIYTLLGWQGSDKDFSSKVIEILTFDSHGKPVFGARIFGGYKGGKNTRVIFRYAARASMMLRFDEQFVSGGKKWNRSARRYETSEEKLPLIIFDHLVPVETRSDASVAPSDMYDGFVFRNGTWNFISGIDARNK